MPTGAELLTDWINRRGYKQAEVAELFGLQVSFVSMLVNGKRIPSLDNAVKIERFTGIPVAAWTSSPHDDSETAMAAPATKAKRHRQ
jgi:transcriptional regulator with XRE-family HTH domain